jgi:type VI secretion system secreted protein Hcp
MAIYVKYGDIKGDVTEETHVGWLEVSSFQWGAGRGISSPVGNTNNREASAPSVSEITVTKQTDIASTKLLTEALEGEGKTVEIDFTKTDNKTIEVYMKYTLTNCMISGYSVSSGGDRPSESLSFNFTKIEYKNVGMKGANETGDPDTVTYDLALAKTV